MQYILSTKYSVRERQTKKNGKVYDVVFRVIEEDGRYKQVKLSGYKTKTECKNAYNKYVLNKCTFVEKNPFAKGNMYIGKNNKPDIEENKKIPTVQELYDRYIEVIPAIDKEATVYDKINIFRMFILPYFKDTPITELNKSALTEWRDTIWSLKKPLPRQQGKANTEAEYYSHKYTAKIKSTFSAFLTWVEDRYEYPEHMHEVKTPKKRATTKPQMQIWTKEQFDTFISYVDNPMWHAFYTLLFYTGRRVGEIIALTPEDIKEDCTKILFCKSITRKTTDGSIYKITTTKEDKVALMPVCKTVTRELRQYKAQSPFLLGGDKPLPQTTYSRHFKKHIALANLPEIRIHDLRHSFVSMLIHEGANYNVIADLISDTVEQVIQTYGHMYVTDKLDILNRIDN